MIFHEYRVHNLFFLLAATITERHNNLWNSIGILDEEEEAFVKVWGLLIGSFAYLVFAAILQMVFFSLYNGKYHPFANILITESDGMYVRAI